MNPYNKYMTQEELDTKVQIIEKLYSQGYKTYAKIFSKFILHLTKDPKVVGYMIPDKGIIVLNRYLLLNQVSTIVRHEILHEYLKHGKREKDKLKNKTIDKTLHELSNIAADYEISNAGYTESDKNIVKNIVLNGEVVSGLVTDIDHPEWVNLTYEEILDKILENNPEDMVPNNQLMIGNRGDQELQRAEDQERQAQIDSEQAENSGEKRDSSLAKTKSSEIINELNKVSGISNEDDDGVYTNKALTPEELEEIQKALQEIQDLLSSDEIKKESDKVKEKEKAEKEEKKKEKYRMDPIREFVSSLNGFIAKEVEYNRDKTWRKLNPTYSGTGILRQGKSTYAPSQVPVVQVYYDRSGSWNDERKQSIGERGIESLNRYVRSGQLKIEKYYFASKVSTTDSDLGNFTYGQPILDNIIKTKPDNVVIITDGDIIDCTSTVQVPGAVWMLFVQGESENLKSHLFGKKLTRSYYISKY